MTPNINPFFIKNCALAAIATGEHASSLIELRDKLATTHIGCIYYHFWGSHLHPEFSHPEYHNDFARWAHYGLHDLFLAERLSVVDPTDYETLEGVRQKLLDVVEERLDENESMFWARSSRFSFIRSKIIVFDTSYRVEEPQDLAKVIPSLPPSSIFYHFIDARGRTLNGKDDFSNWLASFDDTYKSLVDSILTIDPYFFSLTDLRTNLSRKVEEYFSEHNLKKMDEK